MKKINDKKDSKEFKRTTKVPDLLGPLIDRVNLFPPDYDLPGIPEIFDINELKHIQTFLLIQKSQNQLDKTQKFGRKLLSAIESLIKENSSKDKLEGLLKYIFGGHIPELETDEKLKITNLSVSDFGLNIWKSVQRYSDLLKLREQFKALLEADVLNESLSDKIYEEGNYFDELESEYTWQLVDLQLKQIPIFPNFEVMKEGDDIRINIALDEFSQALNDSKTKVSRIRKCKECAKIFWAGRKDLYFCPPPSLCRKRYKPREKMREKSFDRKKERRERKIKKLKEDLMDKPQFTNKAILYYKESKSNRSKPKELPKGTEVKIIDINYDRKSESMPIKFIVETKDKVNGYIVVEYGNQFMSNLKCAFWLV